MFPGKEFLSLYQDICDVSKTIAKRYLFRSIIIFVLNTTGILTVFFVITQVIHFIESIVINKPYHFLGHNLDVGSTQSIWIFSCVIFMVLFIGFIFEYIGKFLIATVACDYEENCREQLKKIISENTGKISEFVKENPKEIIGIFTRSLRACNRTMNEVLISLGPIVTIILLSFFLAYSFPALLIMSIVIMIIGMLSNKKLSASAKHLSIKLEAAAKDDSVAKNEFINTSILGKKPKITAAELLTKWESYLHIYKKRLLLTYKSVLLGNIFYTIGLSSIVIVVCFSLLKSPGKNHFVIYYVLAAQYMFLQARNVIRSVTNIRFYSSRAQHYFLFMRHMNSSDANALKKITPALSTEI